MARDLPGDAISKIIAYHQTRFGLKPEVGEDLKGCHKKQTSYRRLQCRCSSLAKLLQQAKIIVKPTQSTPP